MNKFWIVLLHTYMTKLRSRAFILTTIITMLLVIGTTNMDRIIQLFNGGNSVQTKIAVIDQTHQLFQPLKKQMNQINKNVILESSQKQESALKKEIEKGKIKGYLIVSYEDSGLPKGVYKAQKITEQKVIDQLNQALQQVKMMISTEKLGVSPKDISMLYAPVAFEKQALDKHAKNEKELNQARILVYILLFVIYFSVLFYGSMIAMEVATEKSSRVMEILISSVSPVQQMFGKIFGIACLGLTQYAIILATGFFSIKSKMGSSGVSGNLGEALKVFNLNQLPVQTIIYAIIFFLLGYFIYATLLAMLGSLINRVEDVNQSITPVTLLVVAAFIIAVSGLSNPESPFITITSFIPFFAPMIMFLRVGMLDVPLWQTLTSIALMLGTIVLFVIVGARVYKGGVLMYGTSSVIKTLKSALQLTKKE